MNGQRRLPPFAEDALAMLDEAVGDADDRFDTADTESVFDLLQNRGYIYYVDEQVYITPTDD